MNRVKFLLKIFFSIAVLLWLGAQSFAFASESASPRVAVGKHLFLDAEECDDETFFDAESAFSEEEFDCEDYAEEQTLVSYQVQGNRIVHPRPAALSDPSLRDLQRDSVQHQKIWTLFVTLFPAERRALVSQFVIFTDGADGTHAAVEPDENDLTKWILSVDIADARNENELTETLIHEFGHLLTLNAAQVPPHAAAQQSDKAFRKAQAACPHYFTGEGCSLPTSYIHTFHARFWRGEIEKAWRRMTDAGEDEEGLERFYKKYRDQFVSDYAASDPAEDIAESWTEFVLKPKPLGKTIAQKKISFFYDYPELVELRAYIRARTK